MGCPGRLSFCAPLAQQCRFYALPRFPQRNPGFGRNHRGNMLRRSQSDPSSEDRLRTSSDYEEKPIADHSEGWKQGIRPTANSEVVLKRLLANNDELVITRLPSLSLGSYSISLLTRQLEMLNIFMGFEQSNRYAISVSRLLAAKFSV